MSSADSTSTNSLPAPQTAHVPASGERMVGTDEALIQVDTLEQQLTGLKDLFRKQAILQLEIQRTQATLRERDEHLAAKEREVVQLRSQLDSKTDVLHAATLELDKAREEHARATQALEATLVELELREAALAERESRLNQQTTELTDRLSIIEAGERNLGERASTVDSAARAVAAEHSRLETALLTHAQNQESLTSQRNALEVAADQLRTARQSLESDHAELEAATDRLSNDRAAVESHAARLHAATIELEAQREELRTQRESLESAHKAALAEREELQSNSAAQQREHAAALDAAHSELTALRSQLESAHSTRDSLDQLLTQERDQHSATRAQRDSLTSESAHVAEQLHRADKQLSELSSSFAELTGKFTELTTQHEALLTTHATTLSQRDALTARLARLETDLNELTAAAAAATPPECAATLADASVDTSHNSGHVDSYDVAELTSLRAQLADTTAQLLRLRDAAQAKDEVLTEYEALWTISLNETAQSDATVRQLTQDVSELENVIDVLKDRLRTATSQVKELTQRLTQISTQAPAPIAPAVPLARLERRRARLLQYKSILKAQALKVRRASDAVQKRYEQVEQVLAIRADLAAARVRIMNAETRLNRRNGVTRSAAAVMCMTITLAVVGALSWAIAREVAPAHFQATSTLKATPGERDLTTGELAEWQAMHEALLTDPRLHEALAERFLRQSVPSLGSAAEVGALAREVLTFESPANGELKLRLTGQGSDNTARTLEIFTNGLVNFVNSGQIQRVDGATTTISQLAAAGAEPIDQIRTHYALMFGGVGGTLALMIGTLIWGRLARAKSAFEQDSELDKLLADDTIKV
jgi:chromosome segregation ATPase